MACGRQLDLWLRKPMIAGLARGRHVPIRDCGAEAWPCSGPSPRDCGGELRAADAAGRCRADPDFARPDRDGGTPRRTWCPRAYRSRATAWTVARGAA